MSDSLRYGDALQIADRCTNTRCKKKSFGIRIDPKTFEALEKFDADEFRFTIGQIDFTPNQSLKKARRDSKKPKKTE